MEKVGNDPFVVVYFNADAELGVLPSNAFFLDCHCALRPAHRRQLRVRGQKPLSRAMHAGLCCCAPQHRTL
jgi:hypothetical protein